MSDKKKEKIRLKLIPQVLILFVCGILMTGFITYMTQRALSEQSTKAQTESFAAEAVSEVELAINEYPAHDWMIRYWHEHADTMDIEYDVGYGSDTETEAKAFVLSAHCPNIQIKYADESEVSAMSPEDQKLYAEVTYTWLLNRLNHIKKAYDVDFLFIAISDVDCATQFFLISAADEGAVRGTNYEEVYPLGVFVTVSDSQQKAMKDSLANSSYLADAGNYVDYYSYLGDTDGMPMFVGMTYNISAIRHTAKSQAIRETTYAVFFQLLLSAVCLIMIYGVALQPLEIIQQSIRKYRQTKNGRAMIAGMKRIDTRNEIGELADNLSDLARELDDHIEKIETITAERERISTELALANQIQEDMLPSTFPAFPDRSEFDIYAEMDPAKEVGGDFYDFFLVDDDHLCLMIADVSGKGIPAALFMMASMIVLDNNTMMGKSPARILSDTNGAMCDKNREEMFVTVWLGILEISTGRLTAANAGHEYPVIIDPDGSVELLKDKHGFVIGGFPSSKYTEYELQLKPGSKIFVYSDGVPEAADPENNAFGIDRMMAALNEAAGASPEQILKNVRASVDGFVKEAEQFDDLTMLCLEYKGSAASGEASVSGETVVDADPKKLAEVQAFVDGFLEDAGCPIKTQMQIDVCVEEIFVNIALYAYQSGEGDVRIRTEISADGTEATVTFEDAGIPFDPLAKPDPDITMSAEERRIGGLGIFMTKKMMDGMNYERRDGKNILTIRKIIHK